MVACREKPFSAGRLNIGATAEKSKRKPPDRRCFAENDARTRKTKRMGVFVLLPCIAPRAPLSWRYASGAILRHFDLGISPMPPRWFLMWDGSEVGPFSTARLKELADKGMVKPDDLIRQENTAEKNPAGSVAAIFPSTCSAQSSTAPQPRIARPLAPPSRIQVSPNGPSFVACNSAIVSRRFAPADDWYYLDSTQKQFGPIPAAQLATLARQGKVVPTYLLWKQDMTCSTRLRQEPGCQMTGWQMRTEFADTAIASSTRPGRRRSRPPWRKPVDFFADTLASCRPIGDRDSLFRFGTASRRLALRLRRCIELARQVGARRLFVDGTCGGRFMIGSPVEYQKAQDEIGVLEERLRDLQRTHPIGSKGFTKAGIRKMIAR